MLGSGLISRKSRASRPICGTFSTASRYRTRCAGIGDVAAETPLSQKISKDLKARGFKFVGPTIVYAFMQAVGMVNDHLVDCFRHAECAELGRAGHPG